MTFAHLEVHSHFTLLGGTASVSGLAVRAASDGMSHLALTDTNALYGAVAFVRACREAHVQPIIGMTLAMASPFPPASPSFDKFRAGSAREAGGRLPSPGRGGVGGEVRRGIGGEVRRGVGGEVAPAGFGGEASIEAGHLVLLATGPTGYRSLCRLSSIIQGSPEREMLARRGLSWDEVQANRDGLICLSGGRRGWIERLLRAGDLAAAQVYAGRLAGVFDDHAYLALEIHSSADQPVANQVAALGRRLGLPTVAVQPVYCLAPDDMPRLRLLAAIRENRPLGAGAAEDEFAEDEVEEEAGERASSRRFSALSGTPAADHPQAARSAPAHRAGTDEDVDVHWLGPDDIAARFVAFPDAVGRSSEIAARCGDVLPSGRPIWPALKLPAGQTPDEALAGLAEAGFQRKYKLDAPMAAEPASGDQPPATPLPPSTFDLPASTARARLSRELAAIASHGYAPLFLVVADAVRFARAGGIPVSTRGSVANSLVAYCTGITTVDPIEHGLLFERFLNPARADPPDIDLDFCSRRRDEVLHYLREAYGPEHVALVSTVSTMRPQSAIRETGKAYGLDEAVISRLAALMPHHWHPDPRRRDKRTVDDVLAEIAESHLREIVRVAYTLVGQPDHLSVHPGGVVITPGPLTDVVPVQWAPKGFLITQFEHGDVEAIGLPKMDMLGIRALTVLADTAEMVRRRVPGFRLEDIPLDDPLTAEALARGETIGVFQCESDGSQRTLRKLRARTVRDLAIANAFFKPGPATGGMADAFVRRYRGAEPVTYLHPALRPILRDTKGVLIFQEQVLRVAREVAGLDWAQADQLRRGMGHFGADQMAALREQFVSGCRRPPPDGPGFAAAQAETLWEQVMSFAGYGFNQGHATAYADVSYRSAYLKVHAPAEFLCARLADYGGFHHPAIYMAEAIRLGMAVRPPHVNWSEEGFSLTMDDRQWTMDDGSAPSAVYRPSSIVWMGLGQVRDLRHNAIQAIIAERQQRYFRSLADLLERVELQAKEAAHLVQCGALDGLGASRRAMQAEAEARFRAQRKGRAKAPALQMALPFEEAAPLTPQSWGEASVPQSWGEASVPQSWGEASVPQSWGASARSPEETSSPRIRGDGGAERAELAQHLAWETHILGLPVSALADPLALVTHLLPDHVPLRRLSEQPGRPVTVAGVRLPGWTGGPGFFLSDGNTFVIAKPPKSLHTPQPWRPLVVRGRWLGDSWGSFWLQVDELNEIT